MGKFIKPNSWFINPNTQKWRIGLYTLAITLLIPITIIITIPLLIFRKVSEILVKNFNSDASNIAKIVHPVSQIFLHDYLTPNPRLNIQVVFFGDGHDTVESIREQVRQKIVESKLPGKNSKLPEFPELKLKVATIGGFHYWKHVRDFKMEDYVRPYYSDPDSQNNKVTTEEELKGILATLAAQAWDKERSPWEFVVVNNYVDEVDQKVKKTVAIFRTHHFMADGYSILNMMLRMGSSEGEGVKFSAEPGLNLKRKINEGFRKNRPLLGMLLIPLLLPYQLAHLLDAFLQRDFNVWRVKDESRSRVGQKYYQDWSRDIPVETIKTIKNKFGTSFQAVMNSVVAGGMQSLMKSLKQEVPKSVSSFIPMPLPGHPGGLTNHFGFVVVHLPVGEADPVKRLSLAAEELEKCAKSTIPFTIYITYNLFGLYPTPSTRMMSKLTVGYSLIFSPFPGVDGLHQWGNCKGANVLYTMGSGTEASGATITTLTCFEKIRIGILIDHEVFPCGETTKRFASFIDSEIQTLLTLGHVE